MRNVSNNNGRSGSKTSETASVFEKALQGFSIGDLPYADVENYLKRLLSSGVSPEELFQVLHRHERVEPLPEFARLEISRVLVERKIRPAEPQPQPLAPQPEPAPAAGSDTGNAAGAPAAAATAHASSAAAATAMEDELLALRAVLAARDDTIAQLAGSLDDRDAEIAALRSQYNEAFAELEVRARNHDQLEAALNAERGHADALAADLAGLRTALESEKQKRAVTEHALAEEKALHEALQSAGALALRGRELHQAELQELRAELESRDALLDSQDATLAQLRRALVERDDRLAAALEERSEATWKLHADLEASRARQTALEANLAAAERQMRLAVDSLTADLKSSQDAAAAELAATKSQAAGLRRKLQQSEELIEQLQIAAQRQPPPAVVERAVLEGAAVAPAVLEVAAVAQSEPFPMTAETATVVHALGPAVTPTAPPRPRSLRKTQPPFARDGGWKLFIAAAALAVVAIAVLSYVRQKPAKAPAAAVLVAAAPPAPGAHIHDCPTCPVLTVLPAGRFKQGSGPADRGAQSERPLHWVAIAHPFAMSTNAVTVDNFAAFVAATHRDMKGCDIFNGEWRHRPEADWQHPGFVQTGAHPVTCVSWSDAKAYAAWLSTTTGQRYRLPSASEWEYAARAGGESAQPWTANGSGACANANVADKSAARQFPTLSAFACDDGYVFTAPVGSFKASAFGLNDALGNVFQWTEDCWFADYVHAPVDGSARVSGDCAEHEIRGGSWSSNPTFVRANARNHFASDYRVASFGIRLVREISP
jgi:formylglycine-generating enzyme required for sulfatase activity